MPADPVLQAAFLGAFSECGVIGRAAEIAGCARKTHYRWLLDDPTYPPRFEDARDQACDRLEMEARRRAVEGVMEPVFGSGGKGQGTVRVGDIRRFSDTLLIFLMKGAMPEKYRERQSVEHSGQLVHAIKVVHDEDWYGNDAHALTAESAAAPNASAAIAGPNESLGLRPALGQDGDGVVGRGQGARPDAGAL